MVDRATRASTREFLFSLVRFNVYFLKKVRFESARKNNARY